MLNVANQQSLTPNYGSLRYPSGNFDADTDYVVMTFYNYAAPFSSEISGGAGPTLTAYNSSASTGLEATGTSVILYMPQDMQGQYGGNWDVANLSNVSRGVLGSFGASAAGDYMDGLAKLGEAAKVTTENALTKGTAVANAISSALQMSNFGSLSVNDIFSSTTGQILNPNTEVLYKGPQMRKFDLSFKMAPRNSTEAEQIRKILHAFKYATLPKYGGKQDANTSFVQVPQIVDVTFKKGNDPHPWVNQYKPSVITNLDISYTPDGTWATLPNGSPVATSLKISLQETKMVYANEVIADGGTY